MGSPAYDWRRNIVKNIQRLIDSENSFPGYISDVVVKNYGKLFYNEQNPTSHDSNHAIILNFNIDLRAAIKDIADFYDRKGLIPRIYQAYQHQEVEILQPLLKEEGFEFSEWRDTKFFYFKNKLEVAERKELVIKRVKKLDSKIIEMIHTDDDTDRMAGVLVRHLQHENFHLLAGYIGDTAVTMASIELMDSFSRVDDMLTHAEYRNKGYGSALMQSLIDYHSKLSRNQIYLFASDPTAIHMYKAVGFVEIDYDLRCWSAWRGQISQEIANNP